MFAMHHREMLLNDGKDLPSILALSERNIFTHTSQLRQCSTFTYREEVLESLM